MASIKKLRSAQVPSEAGDSAVPEAAKAIAFKRDQEGRMYVDCGPSYYDEGSAEQSRYMGKPTKKGFGPY